jgi:hypothetical protein
METTERWWMLSGDANGRRDGTVSTWGRNLWVTFLCSLGGSVKIFFHLWDSRRLTRSNNHGHRVDE